MRSMRLFQVIGEEAQIPLQDGQRTVPHHRGQLHKVRLLR